MKSKSIEDVAGPGKPAKKKAPAKKLGAKADKPAAGVKAKVARTMSAKSEQRRELQIKNKRESIIQAALGLFSQFGMHGTSLDQVAVAADVSKTNLLYYFSSKEELYTNVLQHLLEIWLLPLGDFDAEQQPLDVIGRYIRAKLELSRDHPAESKLFCMEIMQGAPLIKAQLQQQLQPLVANKVAVIQQWIDAGSLAPLDPYHLIFSIWSITQHYADFSTQVQAITGKTLADPVFFDHVLCNLQNLICEGVRPR
ncbi:pyrimidine utilization regulatory protein R [Pseudomonas turukhanskensis]|uniref:Pyrimidine utilization regulatory protein R n=2 Tax=Pseudomonas turukhanskensis TaxID=1806536 RepID=A0A9W6KBR4_9PSED|nr:pyrimidine utilization regulatory protein R [Pseudomonas turukhanskensis]